MKKNKLFIKILGILALVAILITAIAPALDASL